MSKSGRIFSLVFLIVTAFALTACGPDYPKCDNDEDCEASDEGKSAGKLFCLNGLCQQCKENPDCGDPSMECNAGVCEQIPGYCSGASECPGNQKCRQNQCGPECEGDDECVDGKTCSGGSCVAKTECSADSDCPGGKDCESGTCVTASNECSLENIYFGYDDASVDPSGRSVLQNNAKCLKSGGKVMIEGHCDERGTSEYNIALGERRAHNAKKYLQSLGVDKDAMRTLSYGEEKTERECGEEGPESCHRANRRVIFQMQ